MCLKLFPTLFLLLFCVVYGENYWPTDNNVNCLFQKHRHNFLCPIEEFRCPDSMKRCPKDHHYAPYNIFRPDYETLPWPLRLFTVETMPINFNDPMDISYPNLCVSVPCGERMMQVRYEEIALNKIKKPKVSLGLPLNVQSVQLDGPKRFKRSLVPHSPMSKCVEPIHSGDPEAKKVQESADEYNRLTNWCEEKNKMCYPDKLRFHFFCPWDSIGCVDQQGRCRPGYLRQQHGYLVCLKKDCAEKIRQIEANYTASMEKLSFNIRSVFGAGTDKNMVDKITKRKKRDVQTGQLNNDKHPKLPSSLIEKLKTLVKIDETNEKGPIVSAMRPGALPCQFPNQVLGVDQCSRTGYKCLGLTLDPYAIICDDGYVVETKSDGHHICRKSEVAINCQEISNLFKSNPVNKREGFKASDDKRLPAVFALTVDELPCERDFEVGEIIGADLCRRTGYTCLGWTPMYLECEKDYVLQNGRFAVICTKKSDSPYCRDVQISVDQVKNHVSYRISANLNLSSQSNPEVLSTLTAATAGKLPIKIQTAYGCSQPTDFMVPPCSTAKLVCENSVLYVYYCQDSLLLTYADLYGFYCKSQILDQGCIRQICQQVRNETDNG